MCTGLEKTFYLLSCDKIRWRYCMVEFYVVVCDDMRTLDMCGRGLWFEDMTGMRRNHLLDICFECEARRLDIKNCSCFHPMSELVDDEVIAGVVCSPKSIFQVKEWDGKPPIAGQTALLYVRASLGKGSDKWTAARTRCKGNRVIMLGTCLDIYSSYIPVCRKVLQGRLPQRPRGSPYATWHSTGLTGRVTTGGDCLSE